MTDCNRHLFVTARNKCNHVFNEEKLLLAERMKQRIASLENSTKSIRSNMWLNICF